MAGGSNNREKNYFYKEGQLPSFFMAQPHTITLETKRLLLKELTPELYDYMFANWDDAAIMQYLGSPTTKDYELEKAKYIKGLTSYFLSFKNFLIVEKATGIVMGKIGFHTWKAVHSRAEIGYGLYNEEHKGKGYMTEAMLQILRYGFEHMELNRVEAFASPLNVPSIRLIEKYGFTKEGLLRQHYGKNGVMEDSAVYGLLKPEFEALYAPSL